MSRAESWLMTSRIRESHSYNSRIPLVTSYNRRLYHTMSLCNDQDLNCFNVDPTIMVQGPDGRPQPYVPFRLGLSAVQLRREHVRPSPLGTPGSLASRHLNGSSTSTSSNSSTASVANRGMPPPPGLPQRLPATAVMRPPVTPTIPAIPQHASPPQHSPPAPNGVGHESSVGSDHDVKLSVPVALTAVSPAPSEEVMQVDSSPQSISSPVRPKSQTPSMTPIPNGFTIPSVNNFSSHISSNGAYPHHAGIRGSNMMKSALAATLTAQDGTNVSMRQPAPYMGHIVTPTSNYSAQLQAARQMQWAALSQQQQQQRTQMLMDGTTVDGSLATSISPPISSTTPARAPSANGTRPVSLSRGVSSPALAQAMVAGQGRASPGATHIGRLTPHPPHSPPHVNMLSPGLGAAQPHSSPPRPQPPMPSPSLQARQIVGGPGVGY
jgi:enhancer of polycomb-like protein